MIQKRSVVIAGHATSVSLEEEFWEALRRIAARRQASLASVIASADAKRAGNLSSALRVLVLDSYRSGELGAD